MQVRDFHDNDWPLVWPIVEDIVRRGDTFCYDPHQTESQAHNMWAVAPPGHVVVAVDRDAVVGTANMYPNRPGPGAHVASGNVMVAQEARARGVGRTLVECLLGWARECGYAGVQFNAVAASNAPAVNLYQKLGFEIIGTVPGAFDHPSQGRVGLHVMYLDLAD